MHKNKEHLATAWDNLTGMYGPETTQQIKKSLFIVQNRLLIYDSQKIGQDESLKDAAFDIELLYRFMDEIELGANYEY